MKKLLLCAALVAIPLVAQLQAEEAVADKPALAPSEVIAAAPAAEWTAIAADDLLVMDLLPDSRGRARRVVIQLLPPPFSQGWVGNIRKLAAAQWWDGLSINRVQDNYVVQWGDADGEDKAKARKLPAGLAEPGADNYAIPMPRVMFVNADGQRVDPPRFDGLQLTARDSYAPKTGLAKGGWPIAYDGTTMWPVHCYGMVGVGRDMPPNTGSGAELYAVIGHAPRHLDRNIALAGRVIEGIEHLSSLPRGTGPLGFYATAEERVPIRSVRLGSAVKDLPAYQFLSTESLSFARYAEARANRRDAFFIRPAGGADICNIPVPVRRVK